MKYIAEDGMIFLNEDACRTHESIVSKAKLEEISEYCSLYDEDLDYVSLDARYKPYIIDVHSNFEEVRTCIDKYCNWSAEGIESNDIYVWGDEEHCWCWETLDSVLNRHEKIIENIKAIKNEISRRYN